MEPPKNDGVEYDFLFNLMISASMIIFRGVFDSLNIVGSIDRDPKRIGL